MRQNHEKYKAMVLEKTTDNPGVESDNTVIAIENLLLKELSQAIDLIGIDILTVPKVNTTTYGLRSWYYTTGARLWDLIL